MSLVASGNPETLDQILKQLNKLIDVIHARDYTDAKIIEDCFADSCFSGTCISNYYCRNPTPNEPITGKINPSRRNK